MSVTVTLPRGFTTHAWRPRVVVEELPGAIRIQRAKNAAEAMRIRDEWRANDYSRTPGEIRLFQE